MSRALFLSLFLKELKFPLCRISQALDGMKLLLLVTVLLFASHQQVFADNGGTQYRSDWTFLALREDGRGISFGS